MLRIPLKEVNTSQTAFEALLWRYPMEPVKSDACEWLEINHNSLNEIDLEDIQLEPLAQKNI